MFSFQTNHVDYTDNGEDCVTKCDWSDGPKKYSMECQNESESWITSSILEILIVRKHEMKQKPYSNDVCHGIMRPRLPEPALLSTADTQSSSDLESPE